MPVNVMHFQHQGRAQWGVVREGQITPIPGDYRSTADFIRSANVNEWARIGDTSIAESQVQLLSPVTRDRQFVCQGANYRQHMIESGINPDIKAYNMIFTKASSCIVAANHDVVRPRQVRFLDYEIELGLIMKRDITINTQVTKTNLNEFIAGIVILNDYSARDIQIPQMQFYKGKSFRTFGPIGPYLCLLEPGDFEALDNLDLELSVNGKIRQKDNTKNLVYGPAETLTELSGIQDLFMGDVIATGTPAGCALSIPSPTKQKLGALLSEKKKWEVFFNVQAKRPYLQPNDVVEARITSPDGRINLGVQRNRIVAET